MPTRSVTLTWTQVIPSPNNISGWGVYYSFVSGGPYTKAGSDVAFVTEQATYTAVRSIDVPDIVQTTLYFVVDTVYTGGTRTEYSNQDTIVFPPIRSLFRP